MFRKRGPIVLFVLAAFAFSLLACGEDSPASSGDTIVYVTATGSKYHRGNCSYLSSSKIPMTLSEAKAQGYAPCSRCNSPR